MAGTISTSSTSSGKVCSCQENQLKALILEKLNKLIDAIKAIGSTLQELYDWLMSKLSPYIIANGMYGASSMIDSLLSSKLNSTSASSSSSTYGSDFVSTNSVSCNDSNFVLANWLSDDTTSDNALIYPNKIENLKKLHSQLLVPLVKYYKGKATDQYIKDVCMLQIITGIASDAKISDTPVGAYNLHYTGQACTFKLIGFTTEEIIDDFLNKRVPVTPGLISNPDGVFITLPYSVNETTIENVYVYRDTSGALAHKFF